MNQMSLLAIWNRCYYVKNEVTGALIRRSIIKREMKGRLRSNPIGKGNKAWKRYQALANGDIHLIANIYLTR